MSLYSTWRSRCADAWLRNPCGVVLIAAGICGIPLLFVGFMMDDFLLKSFLERGQPSWELYSFIERDIAAHSSRIGNGELPWWSAPNFSIRFFRPISSLWFAFGHYAWSSQAWISHACNGLLYLALILGCWSIYRRVLPPWVAAMSLWIFALNRSHVVPLGWISNQHMLLSWTAVVWGVAAYIRWRETGKQPPFYLSLFGFVFGLGAGESALGGFAYLAAYEFWISDESWKRRVRALSPFAILGLVYLSWYEQSGYGVSGSGLYIDPTQDLFEFLQVAPTRIAILIGAGLSGIPVASIWTVPMMRPVLAILGGLLLVGGSIVVLRTPLENARREQRAVLWLASAAVLSLIPFSATFVMDRLLLGANLGLSVCISAYVWRVFKKTDTIQSTREASRVAVGHRMLGAWLYFVYVFMAPVLFFGSGVGFAMFGEQTRQIANNAEIDHPEQPVVVLAAPDIDTSMYVTAIRHRYGEVVPKSFYVLSQAWRDHELYRSGSASFELRILNGAMLQNFYEQLFRSPDDKIPDMLQSPGPIAHIRVMEREGIFPTRVEFLFRESLDASSIRFLQWKAGQLRSFEIPPVGESVILRYEPATGISELRSPLKR